ncbi:DUF4097 family beta strand repeat-containing protein [Cytobacillus purgationiresistens]|uniref:Lia operon protein LiaG n=1 Tax=Cytobacillus purgationiresistens TaxID=863449 RepID=A0ABU0AQI8_9BACI|nr:DUF4097 family beta strand repeat-containing protein [Cytobacillus purgationiresistens]MDQ0273006.1 lia operon protein LiaG [Cytobacillus purgationiresistens]
MKRILIIFVIMIGLYIIFTNAASWFSFGNKGSSASGINQVDQINIDVSSANTTIIPEKRNDIEATVDGKGSVNVKKIGSAVDVEYTRNWMDGFSFFNNTAKVKIYIPEDYNEDLSIDVGSGAITLAGASKENPIKLNKLQVDMSSGAVKLSNIETDSYDHDGSSGILTIDHMKANKSEIEISSGMGKIKHFTGGMNAEISSGKLDIQIDKLKADVNVSASSGVVNLDLPDDADFTLKGKYGSGFITSKLPLSSESGSKGKLEGTMGAGTYNVNVTVSSGLADIR